MKINNQIMARIITVALCGHGAIGIVSGIFHYLDIFEAWGVPRLHEYLPFSGEF